VPVSDGATRCEARAVFSALDRKNHASYTRSEDAIVTKKPHLRESPLTKKEPGRTIDPDAYRHQRPSWRVGLLELVDPFGWHEASEEELRSVHERLRSFETMTWGEILFPPRTNHHNHLIPTQRICPEAQGRLEAIGQAETELLASLHVARRERLWGILEGAVLHVLWWDPEHLIYPVDP